MAVCPQIKMQARKTARTTQEQQSPGSGALRGGLQLATPPAHRSPTEPISWQAVRAA